VRWRRRGGGREMAVSGDEAHGGSMCVRRSTWFEAAGELERWIGCRPGERRHIYGSSNP
jgi:hypothetical protein